MKKRITAIALSVLICLLSFPVFNFSASATSLARANVWDGTIASRFESGSGTASNPYIIKTPQQLAYFMKNIPDDGYSGKYIKLANDIYLNNTYNWVNWDKTPPANEWLNYGKTFKGTFDGNGCTVYGLYDAPLFYRLEGATLKNLRVAESFAAGASFVRTVYANSTIKNCYNEGNVSGGYAGGIAIELNAYKGPILVENCYNTGEITAINYEAGGIVAKMVGDQAGGNVEILTCYNSGRIKGGSCVGGIAGYVSAYARAGKNYTITAKIWNCYNCGDITGTTCVGGITGRLYADVNGSINSVYANACVRICYTVGAVSGTSKVGPIVGEVSEEGSYSDIGVYVRADAWVSDTKYSVDGWSGSSQGGTFVSKETLKTASGLPNGNTFEFGGQNCGYLYPTLINIPHKMQAFYDTSAELEVECVCEYSNTLKILFPENYLKYKDAGYEIKWYRDGQEADSYSERYILHEEDIGHRISAMIMAKGNYTGAVSSREMYIEKATREPLDISEVVICDVEDTSFGIRMPWGYMARLGEDGEWVDANTHNFFDLTPNTKYTVYLKLPENSRYKESDIKTITVTTQKPFIKGTVTVSGENLPGATLTAVAENTAEGETWQYQWYRDGVPIEGATSSVYIVTKFDRGKQLSCGIVGIGEYSGVSVSEEIPIQIIYVDGDVNGDGETQTTDLASIKLFLAGAMKEEEIDFYGADKDQNGDIDTSDLAALKIQLAENQ